MLRKIQLIRCFSLFFIVFVLQQITSSFEYIHLLPEYLQSLIQLATQTSLICIAIFFMKVEGSSFRKHGLVIPEGVGRYFSISLLLAVVYILIIIFLLGSFTEFEAFPAIPLSFSLFLNAFSILLTSIATEAIFRGYIQTNLTNSYGFFPALLISSVMFTFYMFPLPSYADANSTTFLFVLSLFVESTFLALFLKKMKTLLCTITYSASVSLLYMITYVKPIASEYTTLISVLAYLFLVPIMQVFIKEEKMI